MELTISQLQRMSGLLDQSLPLDSDGRRAWLAALPTEHADLAQSLREALLPDHDQLAQLARLATLPRLGPRGPADGMEQPAVSASMDGMVQQVTGTPGRLHGGARIGPYELIRPLGAGGMGEVWLARRADGAFRREVALKFPALGLSRPDLGQRFARERDILASLEHPHIARLYDAGVDASGLPYLSMEYVQGRPVTEWCDAHRLGIPERLKVYLQMLEAVNYAHQHQIIHRDLKPSNVLVTDSGQVRLLDFGVARLLEADDAPLTELTSVHGRAVTPDYASPELLCGEAVDARGDIYSLGVLLYELLTGVRPYRLGIAASIGLLEHAIGAVTIRKPSTQIAAQAAPARGARPQQLARQMRGGLDAIVLKALAKDRARRYPSVATLAEDVRRHLQTKSTAGLPVRTADRLSRFLWRNRTMVTVAAIGGTTVATLLFILLGHVQPSPGELWRDPLARAQVQHIAAFAGTEQAAAISRDGRFAAFLAARDGPLDLWLTQIGSNRYRNITQGRFSQLRNPEVRTVGFSPEGALLTFWARTGDGSRAQDINVMAAPTAGGELQSYLQETAEFDWSPDGSLLVFHTTAPGDPLFLRAAHEQRAQQIYVAAPGTHCHFLTWSTDGKFIYFVRGDPPSADWDLWRLRPSGMGLERLTSHHTRVTYPVPLDAR
ncbi:MAG: serine/threonine-protein kinase, partial [Sinobacteraceae bacterium]|nr:serine/threonine-protein kinase [Nevskiaceae bacterium]